jgi:hypothetical protein
MGTKLKRRKLTRKEKIELSKRQIAFEKWRDELNKNGKLSTRKKMDASY